MDTLKEFVNISSGVGGHVAADPVVMDAISNTKPVRHHRRKAAKFYSWTGEGAGGEDVVVDGTVCRIRVQAVQGQAL